MDRYEYKVINIKYNPWTSKAEEDYLEVLNEQGALGWRFIDFAPGFAQPKGARGIEMIFERKITKENKLS